MKQSDVIVIGSGFAGLMAALASAAKGKTVKVLTYGAGTFPLNSGLIDVLGYDADHKAVRSPQEAIAALPASHPYQKVGMSVMAAAVEFFQEVTRDEGFGYIGSLAQQQWVPTAVGTFKPTCFIPPTMQGNRCFDKKRIIIVGVKGLKDFYADMVMQNIKTWLGEDKTYQTFELDPHFASGRDITTLDVARWLDTKEGTHSFTDQLKPLTSPDTVFILPQILGTEGLAVYEKLSSRLGTDIVEATSMPPSTNGMRLYKVLKKALHDKGVDILENTKVVRAVCEGTVCKSVVAASAVHEKVYTADKFILATGGFYSGGIAMRDFGQPKETIFNLPIEYEHEAEKWSNKELFSAEPQGYAKTGVRTDNDLRPVDENGKCLLENVFVVGRDLGGYDFCHEQCGNGVALVTAYKAAMA
jgi:glycerol-3-phosphate dehydrogenase subunit B